MALHLERRDREALAGLQGPAVQMAMRIVVAMAEIWEADRLIDIESAHIDGCLYHGDAGLEFAERLWAGGAHVVVPTTLNVGAVDLIHPELFQGDATTQERARRLMELYVAMGCKPIWTCAPYQALHRPRFGAHVAWAESNAIVFANSVLGARTHRYGDFIDICCALTGRAPHAGLHRTENRRGQVVFYLEQIPERLLYDDVFYPILGYYVGLHCGSRVPVLVGLPRETTEDQLKALGAAMATSGSVALFHAVGITPEAPTLEAALHRQPAEEERVVTVEDIRATRDRLCTAPDGPIQVVALGSPHFSFEEFERVMPLLEAYPPHPDVEFYICTHRMVYHLLAKLGYLQRLRELGVQVVVDTCVVVTPIIRTQQGVLMTHSGKFAHYVPANTGLQVVFGSLAECVRSAHQGRVWRDPELWSAGP